ncbi:MAG: Uma2 family endonuclease, partial [Armatimonadota bacterium]
PCDVVVRREPLRTRQPDLLFIRQERIADFQGFLTAEWVEIAPDLAIEVLPPSESIATLLKKLDDYHRIGVREVWLVNLATKTVEVLEWQKDGWDSVGIFGASQRLKSKVLPELNFSVVQIFEGA